MMETSLSIQSAYAELQQVLTLMSRLSVIHVNAKKRKNRKA